ncbi:AbrB/MazE/SpoVT family DNA-binding domain-containing protein [Cerasicoccus maritimus]|uniref:AbrB/MazE/SpoVT family DNA-binding domain-containing protein n=1 Tax=Cerasicoccus maritimus TaxID=490089 RepID=UPI002852C6ED|nr:type II toxin-antitoxin system PrlF family antitoxin [Cerasicoccus maritimus]
MTISTMTSKGQTTIPKEIREYLDLHPQQQIAFEAKDGYVIMRSVNSSLDRFAGILPSKRPAANKAQERKAVAKALALKGKKR